MVEAVVLVVGVSLWLGFALYDARKHPPAASVAETWRRRGEDEGRE
jgi:hypothetical protein